MRAQGETVRDDELRALPPLAGDVRASERARVEAAQTFDEAHGRSPSSRLVSLRPFGVALALSVIALVYLDWAVRAAAALVQ